MLIGCNKPHRIAKRREETNMKLILLLALILSGPAYAGEDSHTDEHDSLGHHKHIHHDHGEYDETHTHDEHNIDYQADANEHGHDKMGGNHGGHDIDMAAVKQLFKPLPTSIIDEDKNAALIKLGKKLYLEPRLSINNKISCNSCHALDNFGVDNEPTSPGHDKRRGGRNSPTTLNAALHVAQFWDGRAPDVEAQALGPILNPIEMGMPNKGLAVKRLKADEEYQKLFAEAFSDQKYPFNYKNIGVAIGAFERTLLTPSRFDDFLNGDEEALSKKEKKGLKIFMHMGCSSCHNGVAIGGNMYAKLGTQVPFETADMGRFEVTGEESDKKVFKVPSLRNITKTGPYFHDGSVDSLDEAIRLMAKHQGGQDHVGHGMIKHVKAFLGALTSKADE